MELGSRKRILREKKDPQEREKALRVMAFLEVNENAVDMDVFSEFHRDQVTERIFQLMDILDEKPDALLILLEFIVKLGMVTEAQLNNTPPDLEAEHADDKKLAKYGYMFLKLYNESGLKMDELLAVDDQQLKQK